MNPKPEVVEFPGLGWAVKYDGKTYPFFNLTDANDAASRPELLDLFMALEDSAEECLHKLDTFGTELESRLPLPAVEAPSQEG